MDEQIDEIIDYEYVLMHTDLLQRYDFRSALHLESPAQSSNIQESK